MTSFHEVGGGGWGDHAAVTCPRCDARDSIRLFMDDFDGTESNVPHCSNCYSCFRLSWQLVPAPEAEDIDREEWVKANATSDI